MKIYTRTGDKGETALFGAGRVPKHHPRIDAYGTVDEANCFVGLARAAMAGDDRLAAADALLERLQNELFVLGADLATPLDVKAQVQRVADEDAGWLEEEIDRMQQDLEPLRNFILPGGSIAGAQLHLARTVCRRAERRATELATEADINTNVVIYLNRLSDFLFVAARWVNARSGAPETIWRGRM